MGADPRPSAKPPADRPARAAIWATIGIVALLGLAFFVAVFYGSVRRTHEILGSDGVGIPWHVEAHEEAIGKLGGRDRAIPRLRTSVSIASAR